MAAGVPAAQISGSACARSRGTNALSSRWTHDAARHEQRNRVDGLLVRGLDEAEPGETLGPFPDRPPHRRVVVEPLEPVEQRLTALDRRRGALIERRRR